MPGYMKDQVSGTCLSCLKISALEYAMCQSSIGTKFAPPRQGYWLHATNGEKAFSFVSLEKRNPIVACDYGTCKGSYPEESRCWDAGSNCTISDYDALLCTKGAFGPKCGACSTGFVYSATKSICIACDNEDKRGFIILIAVAIFGVLATILQFKEVRDAIPVRLKKGWLLGSLQFLNDGTVRVLYTNYQVQ